MGKMKSALIVKTKTIKLGKEVGTQPTSALYILPTIEKTIRGEKLCWRL